MLFVRYYLWVAPHLLVAWALVAGFKRGLHRQLPIFSAFVFFETLQFLVLFSLSLISPFPRDVYYPILALGTGVSSLLQLAVIYELANDLLLTQSSRVSVLRPLLRWTVVVLVLAAGVSSGALYSMSLPRMINIFEVLDFCSALILAGMLLALFL